MYVCKYVCIHYFPKERLGQNSGSLQLYLFHITKKEVDATMNRWQNLNYMYFQLPTFSNTYFFLRFSKECKFLLNFHLIVLLKKRVTSLKSNHGSNMKEMLNALSILCTQSYILYLSLGGGNTFSIHLLISICIIILPIVNLWF